MRVTVPGHASLAIYDDATTVLVDLWFSPEGAFQASWFVYPGNLHLARELECLIALDIGIMALRDDEPSRGRSGYQATQYMATGLPVVANPVGSEP